MLYLQHGGGENEFGWTNQGRAGLIMDNLLADGKAQPFIIVMENGGNLRPRTSGPAAATGAGGSNRARRTPLRFQRF